MAKEVYQMPDGRSGYRNRFREGVTQGDHLGTNRFVTGVPQTGYKGESKGQPGLKLGMPIPGQAKSKLPEPQTPHCTAITKAGNACKAAPIRGELFCVGHARQVVEVE